MDKLKIFQDIYHLKKRTNHNSDNKYEINNYEKIKKNMEDISNSFMTIKLKSGEEKKKQDKKKYQNIKKISEILKNS